MAEKSSKAREEKEVNHERKRLISASKPPEQGLHPIQLEKRGQKQAKLSSYQNPSLKKKKKKMTCCPTHTLSTSCC